MTRLRGIAVLISVVLVATIAGCAQRSGADSPAESTPPVTANSSLPTPEPTKPEVKDLLLSTEGLGPLVLGQKPPTTDPSVDTLLYEPDICADVPYSATPDMWVANYPEDAEGHRPFATTFLDGTDTLALISIFSPEISTAEGIHLGSTRADVLAAYPDGFSSQLDNKGMSTAYVVKGTVGQLIIEVTADDYDGLPPGRVQVLTVLLADGNPFTVVGGDFYYWGNCTSP